MEMTDILAAAKQQLGDATGLKPVGATRAFKDDQGWHIGLEMLEMPRIPTATDVLGYYDVLLDEAGIIVSFERKHTRLRGEPFEEEVA